MHVYIDESGTFTFAPAERRPWSTIGAYAVDEAKLGDIAQAYELLERNVSAPDAEEAIDELKSTLIDPDNPEYYIEFVRNLADIGGVFVPSVVYTPIEAKGKYLKIAECERSLPQGDVGIANEKRLQLYLQANALCEATNAALWGAVGYFSRHSPATLREFHWFVDEKAKVDDFVGLYLDRSLSGEGRHYRYVLQPSKEMNVKDFYDAHGQGGTGGFSPSKVVAHYEFLNSKSMVGLKVVDLLTGGLRRSLKGHWNDSERVGEALATLMIQQAPWLSISGQSTELRGTTKTLLPIARKFDGVVDSNSRILDFIRARAKKLV
ncbi:hypothetical protein PSP6_390091 [Paraburkholderia tropica]|uniref:DUF3800 domain-containing protein n=1 Tax=Paraburkholderia tropica TaxID=92647 RepID=UPI001CAC4907|nr:DUF3800 domain-containing protein [Paraburkholderia tropica]CAG9217833.1 hypothetical protein PSP6_390091 [Paraburkholderia tropica]